MLPEVYVRIREQFNTMVAELRWVYDKNRCVSDVVLQYNMYCVSHIIIYFDCIGASIRLRSLCWESFLKKD